MTVLQKTWHSAFKGVEKFSLLTPYFLGDEKKRRAIESPSGSIFNYGQHRT